MTDGEVGVENLGSFPRPWQLGLKGKQEQWDFLLGASCIIVGRTVDANGQVGRKWPPLGLLCLP